MKILIAHRGLLNGPDKSIENKPKQILKAIEEGFDCEIDLWNIVENNTNKLYLGHDEPQYSINSDFLKHGGLWVHCKNLDALSFLQYNLRQVNYFWHQEDDYTLTSFGYIWAYPGKPVTKNTIAVLPENMSQKYQEMIAESNCYGICTDYIYDWKNRLL